MQQMLIIPHTRLFLTLRQFSKKRKRRMLKPSHSLPLHRLSMMLKRKIQKIKIRRQKNRKPKGYYRYYGSQKTDKQSAPAADCRKTASANTTPKTGDSSSPFAFALAGIASVYAGLVSYRKREKTYKNFITTRTYQFKFTVPPHTNIVTKANGTSDV